MWIYLNYEDLVCSQESGVIPSHYHLTSKQSLTAKKINIANQYYSQGCLMGSYQMHQSGIILDHSPVIPFQKASISFTEEVHVSNYQPTTQWEKVWREKIASYSLSSQDLLMKYDPNLYSWKMSTESLESHSRKYAQRLPNSAIVLNGRLYLLPELELLTSDEGGSCLRYPTLMKTDATAGSILCEQDTYFKRKNSWRKVNRKGTEGSLSLARYVQLIGQNGQLMPRPIRGKLNPRWLEWFMGFPTNWTQLKPLGMQ